MQLPVLFCGRNKFPFVGLMIFTCCFCFAANVTNYVKQRSYRFVLLKCSLFNFHSFNCFNVVYCSPYVSVSIKEINSDTQTDSKGWEGFSFSFVLGQFWTSLKNKI